MAKTKFLVASEDGTYRLRNNAGTMSLDSIVIPIVPEIYVYDQCEAYYVVSIRSDARAKATALQEILAVASGRDRALILHDVVSGTQLADAVLVHESDLSRLYVVLQGPGDFRVVKAGPIRIMGRNAQGPRCVSLGSAYLAQRIVIAQ